MGLISASEVRERGQEAEEGAHRREPDVEPDHQTLGDDEIRRSAGGLDPGKETEVDELREDLHRHPEDG